MFTRRSILAGSSAAIIAGAAPRTAWGRTEADVVIIGAGLAGLIAAMRLEAAGQKVIIVEGEKRVGGRLLSLRTSLMWTREAANIAYCPAHRESHRVDSCSF